MDKSRRPWFRPRRYGWGWGLPATWEGWAALALFVAGLAGARRVIFRAFGLPPYLCAVALLVAALIVVCRWSSGPPRWHWGDRD